MQNIPILGLVKFAKNTIAIYNESLILIYNLKTNKLLKRIKLT
jgi:hypothetical protein